MSNSTNSNLTQHLNTQIEGSKWKKRRRYITPAFHFKVLDDFLETFNEQSLVLCRKLHNLSREQCCQIDVYPLMSVCALDIICGNSFFFHLKKL